jgi:magnesium-transporting ATPase (P-type)
MVKTFQDYNDTVITIGLAHLPRNSRIFSTADLAVGIDVLTDSFKKTPSMQCNYNALLPSEIDFVAAISGHLCAFQLRGVASLAYMPTILAHGRASLEAATGSALYLIFGYLSFAFYIFCSVCSVSTTLPSVPIIWAVFYLQLLLPLIGLPISLSDPGSDSMDRVPPKNDPTITFGRKEGKALSWHGILKSIPPAVLPQLIYLICFGEFMIQLEPVLLDSACAPNLTTGDWFKVIRCSDLRGYSGDARDYASAASFSTFVICITVTSAAFIHRTKSIFDERPWTKNYVWMTLYLLVITLAILYVYWVARDAEISSQPWYCFVLYGTMPFICLLWVEFLKRKDRALLDRAEKLRRLQFETRYVLITRLCNWNSFV